MVGEAGGSIDSPVWVGQSENCCVGLLLQGKRCCMQSGGEVIAADLCLTDSYTIQ